MAAMRRKPDATAHHQPVHESDIRLGKLGDPRVHDVFLAPEHLAEIAAGPRAFIKPADVAAGAQAAFARAFQQDQGDGRIRLEPIQRSIDPERHFQRHGIDRLRPVEPDYAGRALAPHDQIGLGLERGARGGHRAPSISLRETISRMISLVPSRI